MDKEIQDMLNDLPNKKFAKLSDKQLEGIEILKSHPDYLLSKKKGGQLSSKKQWTSNRKELLDRSKKGGEKCKEEQKGIFTISKENLSNQGKKGYSNGLGKLKKQERLDISKKAGIVNRDKNSKLKPEDVLYVRKVFIPRHNEFGVVPLSKKYNVSESNMRNAIKGKSFKDILES